MKSTFAFVCFGALFLTSCGAYYQNPVKDPAKTAVLKSRSTRKGLYTWANYVVERVDNQPVNYMTALTMESKEIVLPAGRHTLLLHGSFNEGFMMPGPFSARTDLVSDFEAGKEYRATGRVEGSKLALWIEEKGTSKRVSEVSKVSYLAIPPSGYTPIFIPVAN